MRIAYISETWPPEINGVALTAARTVTWLRSRGHIVNLVRPWQPGETALGNERALRTRGLPLPFYREVRFGVAGTGRLARHFVANGTDLVHIATPGPLGYNAARAAGALGLPLTTDFRTNFHQYSRFYRAGLLRPLILRYLRHFHNKGARTFVPTAALRSELAQQGFARLQVVGRGVDDRLFSPGKRSPELRARWDAGGPDARVLLYVGRLAPEKGLDLVLEAFDALRDSVPSARMVVVGDGPQRRRLQQLHPQVFFAGWQRSEDLARHYASADLFLQPSRSETFGNVTVEAMASGLPVLSYASAAAAQHIRHGYSGLLVEPFDERRFVAAMRDALASPMRLVELGRHAREAVGPLRWDAVLADFAQALEQVASQAQPAWPTVDVARAGDVARG